MAARPAVRPRRGRPDRLCLRILALDTTGSRESVALLDTGGGGVAGEVRITAPDAHSQRVLPAVSFLLESLGLAPLDVGAYAVAVGPGSFTGVRVGISTVQGLALASGRRCLGVPTLDALAARAAGAAPRLVAMIDGFREDVFAAVYDADGRPAGQPLVAPPERVLEQVPAGPAAFVGDGAERYRARILEVRPDALFPARSLFLASAVAALAAPRLERGEGVPPGQLRPLYLRAADIRPPAPGPALSRRPT